MSFEELSEQIAAIGRYFHGRGWALGTSGNFSAVISRDPFRLAITASGVDKAAITSKHVLEVDGSGGSAAKSLKPSSETVIHLVVAGAARAGAVLHTHSVWSTILSESFTREGGVVIDGYEMLKGLRGVTSHVHSEWLPILENTQDWAAEAEAIDALLREQRRLHGFLIRGHGLYTWGEDLNEAKRHVEILEFLLEIKCRLFCAGHK